MSESAEVKYQDIVNGGIIIGALALDVYARRLAGRARTRPLTSTGG